MNKFFLDYAGGMEQIALNGRAICQGDRIRAVLRDDAGEWRVHVGRAVSAMAAGAAGSALWIVFQGGHAFTAEYLRGSGVTADFI